MARPGTLGLAAQWYARGAELGDPEAMFALGVMLAEGQGVVKDRDAAGQMFEAAAIRKHALANYNLALLFLKGEGKPENPQRAFLHMRFAAEAGVAVAQYDLGTLYATGTGVEPNAFEAARWMGKAAAAGHAEAQLDYAVILFQGRGVPPDPKEGARLFRSAAERGLVGGAESAGALLRAWRRRGDERGRGCQVAPDRQGRRRGGREPRQDRRQALQGRSGAGREGRRRLARPQP